MLLVTVSQIRSQSYYLFVGTYTNTGTLPGAPPLDSTGSKGIYVYRFDAATGKATLLSHTSGVCNPSFLTIAPDRHHLYAVTDSRMVHAGTVSAFDFDSTSGKLKFINKVHSGGDNPAYVSVDATGRYAAVANSPAPVRVTWTFHPNGKFAYLIEEMGGCVDVYRYNLVTGRKARSPFFP